MIELLKDLPFRKEEFGAAFQWGVATAAYQIEGAARTDGRGESIWDRFVQTKGRIKSEATGEVACDFYHRYPDDIRTARQLNFRNFRLSLAWPRLFPAGTGPVNSKGADFYKRVIDSCLENNIEPWITLYHWDLPQALEDRGGWTNRDVVGWFGDYADYCARTFGDRVRHWFVLNEPSAFAGFGYGTGRHAPGRKSPDGFLKASHHAVLCQAEGGRILRAGVRAPDARIGTSFAAFAIHPHRQNRLDVGAARRMDALINRLYIEPSLGLGYPTDAFPALKRIEKWVSPGDEERMKFAFDFIGVQYYCRLVGRFSLFPPGIFAREVPAGKRKVPHNNMGLEIYPEGMYEVLKRFGAYPGVKKLIVSENGVSLDDEVRDETVQDAVRIQFFKDYLANLLRARREGVPVEGYFVWTLLDNFEWAEGYHPRFGLVYVDFNSQKRTVKASGHWFRQFLE